jgi:hypothetical protein
MTTLSLGTTVSALFAQGAVGRPPDVPVRIVVEPSYPSPFPEEITFTFMHPQGFATDDAVVSETVLATTFRPTRDRGGMTGEVRLLKDGTFHLLLPRNFGTTYRLIVRVRPNPKIVPATNDRYFLKSVQTGAVNLLEKLLVVSTPMDEIVVTLAKCADATRDHAECK